MFSSKGPFDPQWENLQIIHLLLALQKTSFHFKWFHSSSILSIILSCLPYSAYPPPAAQTTIYFVSLVIYLFLAILLKCPTLFQFKNQRISQPNISLPEGSTCCLIKPYYPLLEIPLTTARPLSGVICRLLPTVFQGWDGKRCYHCLVNSPNNSSFI